MHLKKNSVLGPFMAKAKAESGEGLNPPKKIIWLVKM